MWEEYRRFKPFNIQEIQLAAIAHLISATGGGSTPLEDFMPSRVLRKEAKEAEETLEGTDLDLALKGMFG